MGMSFMKSTNAMSFIEFLKRFEYSTANENELQSKKAPETYNVNRTIEIITCINSKISDYSIIVQYILL